MKPNEWPDLLPLIQRSLSIPFPQRGQVAPVNTFTVMKPSPSISTYLRNATSKPATIDQVRHERVLHTDELLKTNSTLHTTVQHTLQSSREPIRNATSRDEFPISKRATL